MLVAVAAVDAIRSRGGNDREDLAAALREAGVSGSLVYTDRECALRSLALPDLAEAPPPEGLDVGCTFELSSDGERIAPGGAVWTESPAAYAICRGIVVSVLVPPDGRARFAYDGCAPAWRPVGASGSVLTVARGDQVLEVRPACEGQPPCERTLLDRDALLESVTRLLDTEPRFVGDVRVRDLAWLSPTRAVALLDVDFGGGPEQFLAVFASGAPIAARLLYRESRAIEASSSRAFVAVEPGLVLRADGSALSLPTALQRSATALAWSPDEAWLAVATRASIVLLRTDELDRPDRGGPSPRLIRVPIVVRDLAWR